VVNAQRDEELLHILYIKGEINMVVLVIVCALVFVIVFSCCAAAGRADEQSEMFWREQSIKTWENQLQREEKQRRSDE